MCAKYSYCMQVFYSSHFFYWLSFVSWNIWIMERKWDCEDQEELEDASRYSAVINGDHCGENAGKEQEEEEDDDVNGDVGVLKREISCHALYESLVQSHLECLKLCCNLDTIDSAIDPIASDDQNQLKMSRKSELDQFMEAYCMALNKLKESMEEPQQESMAFINYMYSQLKEVVGNIPASPALSPTK